jgi:hypothetical protein
MKREASRVGSGKFGEGWGGTNQPGVLSGPGRALRP